MMITYEFDCKIENFIVDLEDACGIINVDYTPNERIHQFQIKLKKNNLIAESNISMKFEAEDVIRKIFEKHFGNGLIFNNDRTIFWFYQ